MKLKIVRDQDTEKPRWDPVSRFATWLDRYTIGDEQPKCTPDEWLESLLTPEEQDEFEAFKDEYPAMLGHAYGSKEYKEYYRTRDASEKEKLLDLVSRRYFVRTVSAYIHSGITISTGGFSCPWDSGFIGYIVVKKDEGTEEMLESEIELYDMYLQGDVWGYQVLDVQKCNLGHTHETEIDSCYGFYGSKLADVKADMADHIEHNFTDEEWQKAWDDRE